LCCVQNCKEGNQRVQNIRTADGGTCGNPARTRAANIVVRRSFRDEAPSLFLFPEGGIMA